MPPTVSSPLPRNTSSIQYEIEHHPSLITTHDSLPLSLTTQGSFNNSHATQHRILELDDQPIGPFEPFATNSNLETQLAHSYEKIKMRETVIEQLEEEIKAKERLIYEQSHLINILESSEDGQKEIDKHDTDSLASESELTIIERCSDSPTNYSNHSSVSSSYCNNNHGEACVRLRRRLEQAMIDREKLELQNEQLLKQWEEALEYVSNVQKQLQEEIKRNTTFKVDHLDVLKCDGHDCITISRGLLQLISVVALFLAYYLYSL